MTPQEAAQAELDRRRAAQVELERRRGEEQGSGGDISMLPYLREFQTIRHVNRGGSLEDAPFNVKTTAGSIKSLLGTYYGLKDLIFGLDDDDRDTMRRWREAVDSAGGWGTVGSISGDVSQLAIPGGAIVRGTRAAGGGARALLAGESALGAAYGGVKLPETEGGSRAFNAALGGVIPLGVAGTGRALRGALSGISRSPAAQEALEEGVQLTYGRASNNALLETAEFIQSITPFLARPTADNRVQAVRQFNGMIYNDFMRRLGRPVSDTLEDITPARMRELRGFIKEGYERAWGQAGRVNDDAVDTMLEIVERNAGDLRAVGSKGAFDDVVKRAEDIASEFSEASASSLDRAIVKLASGPNEVSREVGRQLRQAYRSQVNPQGAAALRQMDELYPEYRTLVEGQRMARTSGTGQTMTPEMLRSAMNSESRRGSRAAFGEGFLQRYVDQAGKTVTRYGEPGVLINALRGVAMRVNVPGGRRALQGVDSVLTGRTALQRALRSVPQSARGLGRRYNIPSVDLRQYGITPGAVGIAVEREDDN